MQLEYFRRSEMIEHNAFDWCANPRQIDNGFIPLKGVRLKPWAQAWRVALWNELGLDATTHEVVDRHLLVPPAQRIEFPETVQSVRGCVVLARCGFITQIRLLHAKGLFRATAPEVISGRSLLLDWPRVPLKTIRDAATQADSLPDTAMLSVDTILDHEWWRSADWARAMVELREMGVADAVVLRLTEVFAIPLIQALNRAERLIVHSSDVTEWLETLPSPRPELSTLTRLRNRYQCCSIYPALRELLPVEVRLWRTSPVPLTDLHHHLLGAVDRGEKLGPVLSEVLDVPPWVVRLLHRRMSELGGYNREMFPLLRQLKRMTPELAPRTSEEFARLQDFLDNGHSPLVPALDRARDQGCDAELIRLLTVEGHRAIAEYLRFLADIQSLLPESEASPPARLHELLGHPSLREWAALARKWSTMLPGLLLYRHVLKPAARWPVPFARVVNYQGYDFASIATAAALRREGKIMGNCVGNYVGGCTAGEFSIFSVGRDGQPCSTLVLLVRPEDGQLRFAIVGHEGPNREAIQPRLDEAATQFVDDLCCGRIPIKPGFTRWWLSSTGGGLSARFDSRWGVLNADTIAQYRDVLEIAPGRGQLYSLVVQRVQKDVPRAALKDQHRGPL
ncbi:MAG: hypothetical protein ACT4QA_15965 [Panacagrimonas sp.]